MRDYKKYEVWQKAHELTLLVYKEILPLFPLSEQYGLSSQLKRATYSIAMNIAEGCGRNLIKSIRKYYYALSVTHLAYDEAIHFRL